MAVYLERTIEGACLDIFITTTMTWGLLFLVGVIVVFGVTNGITSVFDLAPTESRRRGIAWIASVIGGITIILGMIPIGTRLRETLLSATGTQEGV